MSAGDFIFQKPRIRKASGKIDYSWIRLDLIAGALSIESNRKRTRCYSMPISIGLFDLLFSRDDQRWIHGVPTFSLAVDGDPSFVSSIFFYFKRYT